MLVWVQGADRLHRSLRPSRSAMNSDEKPALTSGGGTALSKNTSLGSQQGRASVPFCRGTECNPKDWRSWNGEEANRLLAANGIPWRKQEGLIRLGERFLVYAVVS